MIIRHALVGAVSAVGSTLLIRELGPEAWATFGVSYLLLVTMDAVVTQGVISGLVRRQVDASPGLVSSAARLALWSGVIVAAGVFAVALVLDPLFDPPDLLLMCAASAVCALFYAGRALPSTLLERELRYGRIAVAEVIDTIAFYAVAGAGVAAGYGLEALAAGTVARGAAAFATVRKLRPAPLVGRGAAEAASSLLPFGVPVAAAVLFAGADGLVVPVTIGRHATELGYLVVATTILGYAALVGASLARVGVSGFSQLEEEELGPALERGSQLGSVALLLLLVPAAGLSPLWLEPLLGGQFDGAAPYMFLVAASLVPKAAVGVLIGALLGRGHARVANHVQVSVVGAFLALSVVLVAVAGPLGAAVALALSRWLHLVLLWAVARPRFGAAIGAQTWMRLGAGVAALGALALAAREPAFLLVLMGVTAVTAAWVLSSDLAALKRAATRRARA